MEPVDYPRGELEIMYDCREERRRHVADNFDDVLETTILDFDERAEIRRGILALAGGRKDRRLIGSVQVDEDGNVVVASLGGGLVQAYRLEALQVQRGDGFGHIVAGDAPQALVRDLNVAGYSADRHLADETHDHLLEK